MTYQEVYDFKEKETSSLFDISPILCNMINRNLKNTLTKEMGI